MPKWLLAPGPTYRAQRRAKGDVGTDASFGQNVAFWRGAARACPLSPASAVVRGGGTGQTAALRAKRRRRGIPASFGGNVVFFPAWMRNVVKSATLGPVGEHVARASTPYTVPANQCRSGQVHA